MSKYLLGVGLAIISIMFSLLVRGSFEYDTWLCFSSLAIVDFIFIVLFFYSPVDSEKVRWICTILSVSMVSSLLSSIIFFMQHHGLVSSSFIPFELVIFVYPVICIVASSLVIIISAATDKKMEKVDDLFWPNFASDFRRNFDVMRLQNTKNGAF